MSTLSNPHIHVGTTSIPPSTISHHSSTSVAESNNDPSSLSSRTRLLVTQQKQVESSNPAKQQIGTLQKQADALLKRLAKHTNWQGQALAQRVADQITGLTSNADYQGAIALLKAWLSYLQPVALQHDCMPVSRMVPLLLKDLTNPKKSDMARRDVARSLGRYAPQLQADQLQAVVKALCKALLGATSNISGIAEALGLCATRLQGQAQQPVIQKLIKVLHSHQKGRSSVARFALGPCAAQLESDAQKQAVQALCHTLQQDNDSDVLYFAGLALGSCAAQLQPQLQQQAIQVLLKIACTGKQWDARRGALSGLGLCLANLSGEKQQRIVQTLLKLLREDEDHKVCNQITQTLCDHFNLLPSSARQQVINRLLEIPKNANTHCKGVGFGSFNRYWNRCIVHLKGREQQQVANLLLKACRDDLNKQKSARLYDSGCTFWRVDKYFLQLPTDIQKNIIQYLLDALKHIDFRKGYPSHLRAESATVLGLCAAQLPCDTQQQVGQALLKSLQSKNSAYITEALGLYAAYLENDLQQQVVQALLKAVNSYENRHRHYVVVALGRYATQLQGSMQKKVVQTLLNIRSNYSHQNGNTMRGNFARAFSLCVVHLEGKLQQNVVGALLALCRDHDESVSSSAIRELSTCLAQFKPTQQQQAVEVLLNELCKNNRPFDKQCRVNFSAGKALVGYLIGLTAKEQIQFFQSNNQQLTTAFVKHRSNGLVYMVHALLRYYVTDHVRQSLLKLLATSIKASSSLPPSPKSKGSITQPHLRKNQQALPIDNRRNRNRMAMQRNDDNEEKEPQPAMPSTQPAVVSLPKSDALPSQTTPHQAKDQYTLGKRYAYGTQSIEQDDSLACYWLQQAAAQAYRPAVDLLQKWAKQSGDRATMAQQALQGLKIAPSSPQKPMVDEQKDAHLPPNIAKPLPPISSAKATGAPIMQTIKNMPSTQSVKVSLPPSNAPSSQATPHQAKDQYALAKRYAYGTQSIEQDDSLACYWLQQAAEQVYRPAIELLQAWAKQSGDRAAMAQQALQGLKIAPSSPQKPMVDEQKDAHLPPNIAKPLPPISSVKATGAPTVQTIKNRHINSRATRIATQIIKALKGSVTQKSALLVALKTALIDHTTLHDWLAAKRLALKAQDIQVLAHAIAEELKFEAVDDLLGSDGKQTLADAVDVGVEALSQRVPAPQDNRPQRRVNRDNHDVQEGYVEITHRIHSQ